MNKSGLYVGIVITGTDDNGNETVRYHGHGPDYHELSQEDVLAMEAALSPLGPEMDDLGAKAEAILLGAGQYEAGMSTPGGSPGKSGK